MQRSISSLKAYASALSQDLIYQALDRAGQPDVFSVAIGEASAGSPVNDESIFSIASNTKLFTAFALALLVDEGKLNWTDPIVNHLPDFCQQDKYLLEHLTVVDLLSHRSGLAEPELFSASPATPAEMVLPFFANLPLKEPFRTGFNYNNAAFSICGLVVARLSGTRYSTFVTERILKPLEMFSTSFNGQSMSEDRFASSHTDIAGETCEQQTWFVKPRVMVDAAPIHDAAFGLTSTVKDMTRWLTFLLRMSNGIPDSSVSISSSTFNEIISPHSIPDWIFGLSVKRDLADFARPTYGLGNWQLRYQETPLHYHFGLLPGSTSFVGWLPEKRVGVVVLANKDSAAWAAVHLVGLRALDDLGGLKRQDWEARFVRELAQDEEAEKKASVAPVVDQPPPQLESYLGRYESPFGDPLEVSVPSQLSKVSECDSVQHVWPGITSAQLMIDLPADQAHALDAFICLHYTKSTTFDARLIFRLVTPIGTRLKSSQWHPTPTPITFVIENGTSTSFEMEIAGQVKRFKRIQ